MQTTICGANSKALDAVASMDREGNFYFVSTRSYPQTLATIYRAHFENGALSPPEIAEGVSRRTPGWVNFDAEISADGGTLYFVDGYFGKAKQAQSARLVAAVRSGGGFGRMEESANIFGRVNDDWLTYAPCTRADELELFVTRVRRIGAGAEPRIYRCERGKIGDPFSAPRLIRAIEGFAEAATIAPDGGSLYFHARVGGVVRIRRVRR